jgi:hypothetical protein
LCSLVIAKSLSKNLAMALGFKGPSQPTQASLGQFLMMRMSWFEFSIPSRYHLKLMMIPITLKICYISIYDPIMPSTWRMRNKHGELGRHVLTTKLKGFQFQPVTQPTTDIIVIRILRWTWLHHHLI